MKPVLGNAWRYATFLILLFVLIAIASHSVISHFGKEINDLHEGLGKTLAIAIWTLTMGCMFIAGALGLLSIRSTAEFEGRKRVSRFVDLMDFVSDGALAVSPAGVISGMNPAARNMLPAESKNSSDKLFLLDAFPCLTQTDSAHLLEHNEPGEIERDCIYSSGVRKLRFRSYPSRSVSLLLITDVTGMRAKEIRERQAAQLQLIGRIAGSVAHDFNNILCAISGHASLLERLTDTPEALAESVEIITKETDRGAELSRQLLDLSRSGSPESPSSKIDSDVEEAIGLLKKALSKDWQVHAHLEKDFGPAPLGSRQIVQLILNLGLMAADSAKQPGVISISLCRPGNRPFSHMDKRFNAVIIVSCELPDSSESIDFQQFPNTAQHFTDSLGVIVSVVRSLVEEAGGSFQYLAAPGGSAVYRIGMPHLDPVSLSTPYMDQIPEDLTAVMSDWFVTLASPGTELNFFKTALEGSGVVVSMKNSIVELLSEIQESKNADAMVLHSSIFGDQTAPLIKAIAKLCPSTGIVLLCEDHKFQYLINPFDAICEYTPISIDKLTRAMINAKTMAGRIIPS